MLPTIIKILLGVQQSIFLFLPSNIFRFTTGYCLEVLGVTNTVMLQTPTSVVVTPALPILKLNSTLPRAPTSNSLDAEDEDYQTLFTSANLYRGHR